MFSPGGAPLPAAFDAAYQRGMQAGQEQVEDAAAGRKSEGFSLDGDHEFDGGQMTEQLWGGETSKAVENFPVSGERVPAPVVHALGLIKAAAAEANAELGELDPDIAERIAEAGDAVAAGEHDDQFPIDVFQTGSGTSSNMNANEVIANLAGDGAHPNDHVNMGQSSNDVFPSAVHLAALGEVTARPAAGDGRRSPSALEAKARSSPTSSRPAAPT